MAKILMIGDGTHYFNKKLVEKLKVYNPKLQIDFFSFKPDTSNSKLPYDNFYVKDISKIKVPFYFNIRVLKILYTNYIMAKALQQILNNSPYSHFHIQYALSWLGLVTKKLKSLGKLTVTIWGSDIYRVSNMVRFYQKNIFKHADTITCSSTNLKSNFEKQYPTKANLQVIRFGLDLLDVIDKEQKKLEEKKIKNLIHITIGYNRNKAQQHEKVINSLKGLDKNLLKKIKIFLPFTYGTVDEAYRLKLIKSLNKLGLQYEFIDNFLPEDKLAQFRLDTDIMLQTQISDQFSGSMQEHIYAGNMVITGAWLKYDDLYNAGVKLMIINDFNDLENRWNYIVNNYKYYKNLPDNKKAIKQLSSWEHNIHKLNKLYD